MNFLRSSGPVSIFTDDAVVTAQDFVFEAATTDAPLRIPTTLEASFQCAVSPGFLEHLAGNLDAPRPAEITFHHTPRLGPVSRSQRRWAIRTAPDRWAARRRTRRAARRLGAHNLKRIQQGLPPLRVPEFTVRLWAADVRETEHEGIYTLSLEARAL